jgi:hypothetical protein
MVNGFFCLTSGGKGGADMMRGTERTQHLFCFEGR